MYIIPVIFIGLMLLIGYRNKYGLFPPPIIFFMTPWAISFLLLSFPLFEYENSPQLRHILYITIVLMSFWVGTCIAGSPKIVATVSDFKSVSKIFAITVAILGIIGQVSAVYDSLHISGITLSSVFNIPASEIRLLHYDNINQGVLGPLNSVKTLLVPFSYLSIILTTYFISISHKNRLNFANLLAFLCGILIVFNSIFIQGGRFGIFYMVGIIFIVKIMMNKLSLSSVHKKKVWKFKKKAILTLMVLTLAIGAWYFSVPYMEKRVNGADPEKVLIAAHRATIDDLIRDEVIANPDYGYLLLSVSYFTSSIPTLLFYLELEDEIPGPYYGAYNFTFVYKPLRKTFGDFLNVGEWISIREGIQAPLVNGGHYPNAWGTALRDLIVDFGYAGVILIVFIMGVLSQLAYKTVLKKQTILSVGLYSVTIFGLMWVPFTSILFVTSYSLLVVYLLLFMFVKYVLRQVLN